METTQHYAELLDLDANWSVTDVTVNKSTTQVDVYLEYTGKTGICPECGCECKLHDRAGERQWRHRDVMQFCTVIHAAVPRCRCLEHKVRTLRIPWARPNSGFTLLFEVFAIKILKTSRSIKDACSILDLNWQQAHRIMADAVERGMKNREIKEIPWIGLDEKSFLKGHDYISLLTDIEGSRVLDVVRDSTMEAAERLINKALNEPQREMVCGVAMDMSGSFAGAVKKTLVNADIVHDKFHIVAHLSDAVDSVRKSEHAKLVKNNDNRLAKTKFLWLKSLQHMSDEAQALLKSLLSQSLQVSKAWHVKNLFESFWTMPDKSHAQSFFDVWYDEAIRLKQGPVTKVANMLKKRLANILTYFECFITNAITEGFNSKIQSLKANARGFRNFENYRISILFHCGKLDFFPLKV